MAFRKPIVAEQRLMRAMTAVPFVGDSIITRQLESCVVETIDENGSFAIKSQVAERSGVVVRIPAEIQYTDSDGINVHALLHVIDGFAHELEVYREDNGKVQLREPNFLQVSNNLG